MESCIITGEPAEIHHILSRGAYAKFKDEKWNHMALTRDKHVEIHKIGRNSFIKKYKLESFMLARNFEFIMGKWIHNGTV